METISDFIIPQSVTLYTAADVAQHGFIVQHSISPLNLELCQRYEVYENQLRINRPSFSYSNEIITTEEKCRKIQAKQRSLLYTLHLDLPKAREGNLRSNVSQQVRVESSCRLPDVAQINIKDDFYDDFWIHLIPFVCEEKIDHFRFLKWLIKRDDFDDAFRTMHPAKTDYFFKCIQPELEDSEFVIGCLRKLDVYTWILYSNSSSIQTFKNLVYQIYHTTKNGNPSICFDNFVEFCTVHPSLKFLRDALNLRNAPRLSANIILFYLEEIYLAKHAIVNPKINGTATNLQRCALLHQAFWVYIKNSQEGRAEFLLLIWSSVPDPLLSFHEIRTAFEEGFTSEEITGVYNFYSDSVGAMHSYVEPRTLKHYCRTFIRRRLTQLEYWLPDGIKELGLPKALQSYLNLM